MTGFVGSNPPPSLISCARSVNKVKESLKAPQSTLLAEWDNLANLIAKFKGSESRSLVEILTDPKLIDPVWDYFAADSAENQLIRPDDYNFNVTFVHSPLWIALLMTKLSVPPPPLVV